MTLRTEVLKAISNKPITISEIRDKVNESYMRKFTKQVSNGSLTIEQALKNMKETKIERPDIRRELAKLVEEKQIVEMVGKVEGVKFSYKRK